ncbi:MAG: hypothetical protein Q7W30_06785 [Coriobacteriia bacterium]|nr:hypothetical protein [Coriobacteriia bacterium]
METDVRVSPGAAKRAKRVLAAVVFAVMGRGLVACARLDSRVRAEADSWPDGTTITLAIAPHGPRTTVRKTGDRLVALGGRAGIEPTLLVTFKNVDGAVPVLLGIKSVLQSFAEHRASLSGDIALGISLVRCLHVVEGYLFPDLMTRRILPRPATREVGHVRAYAGLLARTATLTREGASS